MKYIVEIYKGRRNMGLAVQFIFDSQSAAQFWIDHMAYKTREDESYHIGSMPCYDLENLQYIHKIKQEESQ